MKTILALSVVALLWSGSAADVSGVWNLEMKWESGAVSTGVCKFKQNSTTLTGTCGGDDKFPITGEVSEGQLTWEFDVEQGGARSRMTFAGALDEAATTIKGTCRIAGGQSGTFNMKKQ